jgi:small ligand-binding sensory domain FIST
MINMQERTPRIAPTPVWSHRISHNAFVALVGEGLALASGPGPVDMPHLARQAAKQALLHLGSTPNLAFVFVAAQNAEDAEQGLLAAAGHLPATTVLGTSASGVIASGRGTDDGTAVSVWVARIPGLRARSFHLEVLPASDGHQIVGLPGRRRDDVIALLFTDPWSFPASDFTLHADTLLNDLPLVGAVASGPAPARTTRFLLDGRIHSRGAVGVMLGGHIEVTTLMSPGSRPVGPVLTVTDAEGFLLRSLAGTPAALRAQEVLAALEEPDRGLALAGMQLGVAVGTDDPRIGDFVLHDCQAADGERGALQMAAQIPVGATVQFHVRDEEASDEDLNVMLEGVAARMGSRLEGALMFASTNRGRFMFDSHDHDAAVAHARLLVPVTGFFADAEFAPLRGHMTLNRGTATVIAFGTGARAQVGHTEAVRPQRISETDPLTHEVHKMLSELTRPPDEGIL